MRPGHGLGLLARTLGRSKKQVGIDLTSEASKIYVHCNIFQGLLLNLSRAGSSGTVYETTKITSKMLDAETSYMLDRYSR